MIKTEFYCPWQRVKSAPLQRIQELFFPLYLFTRVLAGRFRDRFLTERRGDIYRGDPYTLQFISELKKQFEKVYFRFKDWSRKIPMVHGEIVESTRKEIRRAKKSQLLLEFYRLVFEMNLNHHLVRTALGNFLTEHRDLSEFSDLVDDPLTLLVNSLVEHAAHEESAKQSIEFTNNNA